MPLSEVKNRYIGILKNDTSNRISALSGDDDILGSIIKQLRDIQEAIELNELRISGPKEGNGKSGRPLAKTEENKLKKIRTDNSLIKEIRDASKIARDAIGESSTVSEVISAYNGVVWP